MEANKAGRSYAIEMIGLHGLEEVWELYRKGLLYGEPDKDPAAFWTGFRDQMSNHND